MSNEIKIINVEKSKKNYIITTSKDEYIIDEDTLLKYMIFKDKVYTCNEFKQILEEIEINKAFNQALKYLAYGMRSVWQIKDYLTKKNTSLVYINKVIDKLNSIGYLDDQKLAITSFEYYLNNYKGPKYIKQKLIDKNIDKEIINKVLDAYSEDQQINIINQVIDKQLQVIKSYPINKQKQILASKLIRNGFNSALVFSNINNKDLIDESYESLNKDYQKIKHKISEKNITDYEKKQKIIAFLTNKGYEYQKICEIIE